jgi:hypothetical protein
MCGRLAHSRGRARVPTVSPVIPSSLADHCRIPGAATAKRRDTAPGLPVLVDRSTTVFGYR